MRIQIYTKLVQVINNGEITLSFKDDLTGTYVQVGMSYGLGKQLLKDLEQDLKDK